MRNTIRVKLIGALVIGLALIAGATAVLMQFVHDRAVAAAAQDEVATAANVLAGIEELEVDRMSALLKVIVADDSLAARFAARDRAGLLEAARPVFEELRSKHGVTIWEFNPPDPAREGVFLRVQRPELHGDTMRWRVAAQAAAELREASGRELGRTGFALRVARPWMHKGQLLGFVELGEDVTTFLARVKGMTGDDLGMLLAKERLDRNAWNGVPGVGERWDALPELVAVETTTGDLDIVRDLGRLSQVPDQPAVIGYLRRAGGSAVRGIVPLRDSSGAKVGAMVVVRDVSALYAGVRELRIRVVVLVVLLAAGLGALLVFLLEVLVFERLTRMERVLEDLPERLARGEYELAEPGPERDDEIGRFERFFWRALREIGSFVADIRRDPGHRGGREP